MKTLKTTILALVIVLGLGAAKANTVATKTEKLTVSYAVDTYVNAIVHGKIDGLNDIIDNNAKFSILRGKEVLSFNKADEMAFVKANKNIELDCTTQTSISQTNADFTVVKIDMKFKDFTRSNYVTMANTGNGWKITSIYSVFK